MFEMPCRKIEEWDKGYLLHYSGELPHFAMLAISQAPAEGNVGFWQRI
jgi:hypothetical protein